MGTQRGMQRHLMLMFLFEEHHFDSSLTHSITRANIVSPS